MDGRPSTVPASSGSSLPAMRPPSARLTAERVAARAPQHSTNASLPPCNINGSGLVAGQPAAAGPPVRANLQATTVMRPDMAESPFAITAATSVSEVASLVKSISLSPNLSGDSNTINALLSSIEFYQHREAQHTARIADLEEKLEVAELENQSLQYSLRKAENSLRQYEKLSYIQGLMDRWGMEESIREIQAEIRRYDDVGTTKNVERERNIPMAHGTTDEQAILSLVQLKFKTLEDYVFVLKKRLLMHEAVEDATAIIQKHGSLEFLLQENERLQLENKKLRLREVRYAQDVLLKRRNLVGADESFVQMLVMTLQNELGSCMRIIQETKRQQEMQAGSSSLFGGVGEQEDSLPSLSELLNPLKVVDLEEVFSGPPPPIVNDSDATTLLEMITSLEFANGVLQERLKDLERERELVRRVDPQAFVLNSENDSASRKMEQLAHFNKQLTQEVQEVHSELLQKDKTLVLQHDIIREFGLQRAQIQQETLVLGARLERVKDQYTRTLKAQQSLHHRFQAMTKLAMSLALRLVGGDDRSAHTLLSVSFRDLFSVYWTATQAAIRIQAWFRGYAIRQQLLQRGVRSTLMAYSKRFGAPGGVRLAQTQSTRSRAAAPQARHELLPHLRPLLNMLTLAESQAIRVCNTNTLLEIAKTDIVWGLKKEMTEMLSHEYQSFTQQLQTVNDTITRMSARPDRNVGSQVRVLMVDAETASDDIEDEYGDEYEQEVTQ